MITGTRVPVSGLALALARAGVCSLPQEDPHAHLRHRALPNVDPARTRTRVLRIWSAISASVLLTGLALVILGQFGALLPAVGGLAVLILCAEAFARGHLVQFVAGLLAVAVVAAAAWLATWAALGHWRSAIAVLLILAAAALALADIRDFSPSAERAIPYPGSQAARHLATPA